MEYRNLTARQKSDMEELKNENIICVQPWMARWQDGLDKSDALASHWGIENNLHWVLAVVFDEDFSTVRKDNSAQNLNILRKYALNVLKQVDFSEYSKKKNLTISNKQHLCDKREEMPRNSS